MKRTLSTRLRARGPLRAAWGGGPRGAVALCGALIVACGGSASDPPPGADEDDVLVAGPDAAADTSPSAAPFTLVPFDGIRIHSRGEVNVRRVDAEVDLGPGPFAEVRLHVALGTTCYPFESWSRPPEGHRWPEDCDAFDRNFEILLDPAVAEGDPPGIELERAITPFGGPMTLDIDMTDVANARPGVRRLRAVIGTWSDPSGQVTGADGGWDLSAWIAVTPGPPPRRVLAVEPLFDWSHGRLDGPAEHPFTLPEGTARAVIAYRVTGHGGGDPDAACIGPAEEFCRREHRILLDGELWFALEPWRDDCHTLCTLTPASFGSYCAENPTGLPASVRAPRANWCPGSVTPPFELTLPSFLAPGPHTFAYGIPAQGGGSWRVSAALYAYGPR